MHSAGTVRHASGGPLGARGSRGTKPQRVGDYLDGATWASIKARAGPHTLNHKPCPGVFRTWCRVGEPKSNS